MDFIRSLEQSGLAAWVRESGTLWSYPTILFCHTLGLATLAGASGVVSLRLLGFGRRIPLSPLRGLFPLMWIAFGITAASGLALLIADASARLASPVFWVKRVFVALALVTLQLTKKTALSGEGVDERPVSGAARALAVASLLFWIAATTAGRLMAYLGPAAI